MARTIGSKNRLKVPVTSHLVKYSVQTLREGLQVLDSIISSTDKSITLKNKLDAFKEVRAFLDMAGYGDELKVAHTKLMKEEGETNEYRGIPEGEDDEDTPSTTVPKSDDNVLLGRFKG